MTGLLVAVDATPLLGNPTGVGVFSACLLAALASREDMEVSAFAVSWRRRRLLAAELPRGVRWRQRPMPARPLHFAWRRLGVPPVEWFVGRTDIVHGSNFVVPPTRRAAAVVTVHDLTPVRFPQLCDRSTLVFPELIRAAIRRGAWVHTHSEFVATEVVEHLGADPARVRAVHSGVPTVAELPGRSGAGAPCSLQEYEPGGWPAVDAGTPSLPRGAERYVLAIGTAEPRKDLPGLVRAFGEVASSRPDVALVLAGPEGWGSEDLARAVAESPARARVLLTGWLDENRLAVLLRHATVLAYPSLYEGFGFPPLEAMSVGVPVVATSAGSLPEVVAGAAELVPPGDAGALAEALGRVLDEPERRGALIERGRERAAELTWERCAEGIAALYRDAWSDRAAR